MPNLAATMTVLEPYPSLYAYYDGRIAGKRLHSEARNWLDDGAYELGIASYAIVAGDEAIVYDTHASLDHARAVRAHLQGIGVTSVRVVLSHWHTDHVAGNQIFSDCEIIANHLTAKAMQANRDKLENGDPPIRPVVVPNRLFEGSLSLTIGGQVIELLQFDIHSADGTVIFMPESGILLAGDTLEDTITYISEPEHTTTHIAELNRLASLPIRRILPNHGERGRIASGGYDTSLIEANRDYLQRLLDRVDDPALDTISLRDFVKEDVAAGRILYFEPYEKVHKANIAEIRRARGIAGMA